MFVLVRFFPFFWQGDRYNHSRKGSFPLFPPQRDEPVLPFLLGYRSPDLLLSPQLVCDQPPLNPLTSLSFDVIWIPSCFPFSFFPVKAVGEPFFLFFLKIPPLPRPRTMASISSPCDGQALPPPPKKSPGH